MYPPAHPISSHLLHPLLHVPMSSVCVPRLVWSTNCAPPLPKCPMPSNECAFARVKNLWQAGSSGFACIEDEGMGSSRDLGVHPAMIPVQKSQKFL